MTELTRSLQKVCIDELPSMAQPSSTLFGNWRTLVERAPESVVDVHPDLLESQSSVKRGASRLLIAHRSCGDSGMQQLAVLQNKTVRLPILRGFPWRPAILSLRLVGNCVLGARSLEELQDFLETFMTLLTDPTVGCECVFVDELDVDSPLWHAMHTSNSARILHPWPQQFHYRLKLPAPPVAYWERFSAKRRRDFRQAERKLPHEVVAVRKVEGVNDFVSQCALVASKSWKTRRLGVRVRDDDETSHHLLRLAQLGALRSYLLRIAGEPIAFVIGTQWNRRFTLEEMGYDPKFAALSPGKVLLLRILEDVFEHDPPDLIDFGFGDAWYKEFFCTDKVKCGPVLLLRPRLRLRVLSSLNRAGALLENRARRLLSGGALYRKLRQRYHH